MNIIITLLQEKNQKTFSSTNFKFKYIFKIILIRDASVEKTSLIYHFINNHFNDNQTNIVGPEININT